MTPELKKEIKSIKIDTNITIPKSPYIDNSQESAYSSFGIIGTLTYLAISQSANYDNNMLFDYFRKADINITSIYNDLLLKNLKKSKFFKYRLVQNRSKYILKSEILSYGFLGVPGFNRNYHPGLQLKLRLINSTNNKIVWSKYEYITGYTKDLPHKTLKEYFSNSKLVKQGFNDAINILLKDILQDLE